MATRPQLSSETIPEPIKKLHRFFNHFPEIQSVEISPEECSGRFIATISKEKTSRLEAKLKSILLKLNTQQLIHLIQKKQTFYFSSEIIIQIAEKKIIFLRKNTISATQNWIYFSYSPKTDEPMEQETGEEWQTLLIQSLICLFFLIVGWSINHWTENSILSYIAYSISLIAGGWDAAIDSWHNLRKKKIDIHFLMLFVALGSIFIGSWNEGALLLFLFSFANALEQFALHRTHKEISSLTKNAPKIAKKITSHGEIKEIPVEQIEPGDILQILPGDAFPIDGIILSGKTDVDESTITGESIAVAKSPGDNVFSGTINDWGALEIKCLQRAELSTLQKIIQLIQNAQQQKSNTQRFTEKFSSLYSISIISLTILMFLVWWLILGFEPFISTIEGEKSAFYRAITLLIVMSPCALVLSIPSAILASIAHGAKRGILFRGGIALEKLTSIRCLAMDKTGTLTQGEPKIVSIESFPAGNESTIFSIAASLEQSSNHPLARAIKEKAKENSVKLEPLTDFRSITGKGVSGKINGKECFLGRQEICPTNTPHLTKFAPPPEFSSEVWVFLPEMTGRIILKDEIRAESKQLIPYLKSQKLAVVMLTGDRKACANEIGQELGLDEIVADLSPEQKVQQLHLLREKYGPVAMIGDGVNDSPCLAAADVAIAMGGRGSEAAMEQSDIVLVNDRIEKLANIFLIGKKTHRIIRQNLILSMGTVLIMACCAIAGWVPITLGVIIHEGSTILVCLNSLRLLLGKSNCPIDS